MFPVGNISVERLNLPKQHIDSEVKEPTAVSERDEAEHVLLAGQGVYTNI